MAEFLESLGFDNVLLNTLKELLIVLGIGLLLGLEREHTKIRKAHVRLFAGVRTFPIVGMAGYLSLFLASKFGVWIFVAAFLGTVSLIALAYYRTQTTDTGTTTEFTLMITFILGGLIFAKFYHISVTVAVLVTVLLTLKIELHKAVSSLSESDILSIIKFVIIAALVLPVLANRDFGPYGAFNFYKIWLIVAIFVSLNFVAYFLSKYLDQRKSVILTGILGGFASSTATAWFFSHQSRHSPKEGRVQSAAIILASSIMFPRLLVWLLLLNMSLFMELWLPVLSFGALGLTAGYFISKKHQPTQTKIRHEIGNPINFREGLLFAGVYIVIQLLIGYAEEHFGSEGIYIASGISGITDIDAITISMANYSKTPDTQPIAATAILIAAFANTLMKYLFCLLFGNAILRKYTSLAFVPLFLIGLIYIVVVVNCPL